MTERLFVYGTLRPGMSNEHFLAAIPGTWMNASVRGIHFPEGYGATIGYPVIVPTMQGSTIPGLVLEANFTIENWQLLDEFETEAYERVLLSVMAEDGRELDAFAYILNQSDIAKLKLERPEYFSALN